MTGWLAKVVIVSLCGQGLYKSLLRNCERLPPDASKFYKRSVRKEFDQHRDEVNIIEWIDVTVFFIIITIITVLLYYYYRFLLVIPSLIRMRLSINELLRK